jgi:hypothetical protein
MKFAGAQNSVDAGILCHIASGKLQIMAQLVNLRLFSQSDPNFIGAVIIFAPF